MRAYTRVATHHVFVLWDAWWQHATRAFRHGGLYARGRRRRPMALCIVLGLMTWCATSGPHAVHHLFDQQQPACLVVFLIQSTPVTPFLVAPLSVLPPAGVHAGAEPWHCPISAPRARVAPRAPPAASLQHPLSDCGNCLPGTGIEVEAVL
jgi:hypothetical protein